MQVKYTFSITIIAEDLHPSVVPGGARAGGGAGVGAVLHQLRVALGLERLPGNLLDDIAALLPGGGETLPGVDVGALLLVDELGDGDLDQAAHLLGRGVADLPRHRLVVTHLLGHGGADLLGGGGALPVHNLPGVGLGHQGAHTAGRPVAVLLGHLCAGLAVGHLALHLGHLGALQLGHVGALLARHCAALPLAGLGALGARHVGALLGVHGVAHALLALLALLLGAVAGVLGLALLPGHVPALLLGRDGALPVLDDVALLGRDILAHLVLDGLALAAGDDLALCDGAGGADLLHDGLAALLVARGAALALLGAALLLVHRLLQRARHRHAVQLGAGVALLLELGVALLVNIVHLSAVLLVLLAALLPGDGLLHLPLHHVALPLLGVGADLILDIATLAPGDALEGGPGHLLAHLLRHLAAGGGHGLADEGRRVELQRQLGQGEDTQGGDESLHGDCR